MMNNLTLNDFNPGDDVRYIPTHAYGDKTHEHCENGIVSSVSDKFVFVKYFRNGLLQNTAESTPIENLILWRNK